MKSDAQLKEERRELEIITIVFDQADHLRGTNFENWLKKLGKENLGKQTDAPEEAEKKLTAKQKEELWQYENECLGSGGKISLADFKKLRMEK